MIFDLPTELFEHILMHLDDSDLTNIRPVCRNFDAKSFTTFGRRRFRVRQYMLSSDGLQALCGVANGRFGQFIRVLRIGSEALVCCRGDSRNTQHRALHELCESQIFFRLRGLDTALLTVALRALDGTLNEVVVAGSSSKTGRRSWGARRLESMTGTSLIHEQTRTLATTLSAIAASQIRLVAFGNEPQAGQSGIGAHRDSIAMPSPLTELLSWSFSTLRILQLSLWVPEISTECRVSDLTTSLVRLLSTMPHLEQLHLGLQRVMRTPQLGEGISSGSFSTNLRSVHVVGGWVHEEHFYHFIMNHQDSLQTVVLEKAILEGGWHRFVQRLDENTHRYGGKGLSIRIEDVDDVASIQRITASRQICIL